MTPLCVHLWSWAACLVSLIYYHSISAALVSFALCLWFSLIVSIFPWWLSVYGTIIFKDSVILRDRRALLNSPHQVGHRAESIVVSCERLQIQPWFLGLSVAFPISTAWNLRGEQHWECPDRRAKSRPLPGSLSTWPLPSQLPSSHTCSGKMLPDVQSCLR